MLFNSFEFIFLFLPITLFLFKILKSRNARLSLHWLIISSLIFYTWWYPPFLLILSLSTIINYLFGSLLNIKNIHVSLKKVILILGLAFNISLICYFKYIDFALENINLVFNTHYPLPHPLLPLAISFFTFQKISYLIDGYKLGKFHYSFSEYCFFVCFFPQLIAGPIVQHKDIIPQIPKLNITSRTLHIGLCYFILGLAKKVLIADHCAQYATPLFAASTTTTLSFAESWLAAIAYSLQLYFDFSGYSDMALGLGRMFNIKLPINFNSPYKSINIIEFWRRWHITLSHFLRNYIYIPLGGNQKGIVRQYGNLLMTMLIGGLWHGANWTFIIWGGLHGIYLIINHTWQKLSPYFMVTRFISTSILNPLFSRLITLFAVVIGWVYFRADSIATANAIVKSMLGLNGISLTKSLASIVNPDVLAQYHIYFNGVFPNVIVNAKEGTVVVALVCLCALFMPNTHQLMQRYMQIKTYSLKMERSVLSINKSYLSVMLLSLIGAITILFISKANEFLYFQF